MHTESLRLMGWLFKTHLSSIGNVGDHCIDIGSQDINGTYKQLCSQFASYTGADIAEGPNVDILLPERRWLASVGKQYEIIISGQCLEHVRKPWEWILEVKSLMKPDGWLFLIAPYSWRIHRYPLDCWRILPDGMEALLETADLVIETIGHTKYKTGNGDTFGVARASTTQFPRECEGRRYLSIREDYEMGLKYQSIRKRE